jgi:hypothetical protein
MVTDTFPPELMSFGTKFAWGLYVADAALLAG